MGLQRETIIIQSGITTDIFLETGDSYIIEVLEGSLILEQTANGSVYPVSNGTFAVQESAKVINISDTKFFHASTTDAQCVFLLARVGNSHASN